MKTTLLTVLDFYDTENEESDEKTRVESAFTLPERIRARKEETSRQRSILAEHRGRVQTLVTQINEIHPRLEEQLLAALATLPPLLDAARTAHADVLALTLEAALLKLSVLRARAHIALYGHAAPSNPRATMARALAAAQEKLRAKQRAQEDEERALDAQLAAYEGALGLVGGREGGFAQLVEDMARVRRETEECRKDLRRLGWTGD